MRFRFPAFKGRPIVHYLVAIGLVTILPSLLFAGVLMHRNQDAQQQTVETLILATSRSLVQRVEREITANTTTLRVLATSPAFHTGDFRAFHERAVLALAGTGTNLFVLNADNSTAFTTRRPYDTPSGWTADPEAAQKALATDEVVVTDLVLGAVSQQWVYNILMPIDLGPYGRKVVALNQPASNFDDTLVANRLPEGWKTALIDNEGRIIAATSDVGAVGSVFSQFDVMARPLYYGWQRVDTAEGPARLVVLRSALTGWRTVAWAPEAMIARPMQQAMLSLALGGLILVGLVVIGLIAVSRMIGSSVRGLARDARLLGQGEVVEAKNYPVLEIASVSEALEQASRQRQASEREVNFLMREVAHRSKNQMTVITAMAKQTARGADDVASYVQSFERRILGLARSTDLLLTHGRAGVLLGELLENQLAPFSPPDASRLCLEGPVVRLNTQAAQIMGMAAHELSTNAVKYGAFSEEQGRLDVRWSIADDRLDFVWRETVPSRPEREERPGFGTTVLKSMVGRSLGAEVERICHEDGMEWRFSIPLSAIDPARGIGAGEDEAAE
ncbi:sensor histidine kinase [Devosia sp.]|uniref:sensor histidine kinase n=1 Tax=Devosia sp. TaxID=1871048 RepID=UPI002AFFCC89|nr:sensor histidine kinase [Devosia sp.]